MMRTLTSNVSNIRVLSGDGTRIIETKTITGTKASRITTRSKQRSHRSQEDTEETKVVAEAKSVAATSPDSGPG